MTKTTLAVATWGTTANYYTWILHVHVAHNVVHNC